MRNTAVKSVGHAWNTIAPNTVTDVSATHARRLRRLLLYAIPAARRTREHVNTTSIITLLKKLMLKLKQRAQSLEKELG